MNDPKQKLMELDSRHNELLDRLAELDREIIEVLGEWTRIEGLGINGIGVPESVHGGTPALEPVMNS